jgi:hypothetical protein
MTPAGNARQSQAKVIIEFTAGFAIGVSFRCRLPAFSSSIARLIHLLATSTKVALSSGYSTWAASFMHCRALARHFSAIYDATYSSAPTHRRARTFVSRLATLQKSRPLPPAQVMAQEKTMASPRQIAAPSAKAGPKICVLVLRGSAAQTAPRIQPPLGDSQDSQGAYQSRDPTPSHDRLGCIATVLQGVLVGAPGEGPPKSERRPAGWCL